MDGNEVLSLILSCLGCALSYKFSLETRVKKWCGQPLTRRFVGCLGDSQVFYFRFEISKEKNEIFNVIVNK